MISALIIIYFILLSFFLLDILARMENTMPTLDAILSEVDQFIESEKSHTSAPHVIDVILPLLCAYLPSWWSQGPDNVSLTAG